jgi:hypothetical protein
MDKDLANALTQHAVLAMMSHANIIAHYQDGLDVKLLMDFSLNTQGFVLVQLYHCRNFC